MIWTLLVRGAELGVVSRVDANPGGERAARCGCQQRPAAGDFSRLDL
ncbi:MAG: hypothetical protein K2Y37_23830 [Pirellulales bacterium]|nr:hypothetical protein [Pirellulales bacterium]